MNQATKDKFGGFFRLVPGAEDLPIGPTDGTETIAQARDTFPTWIDLQFVRQGTDVSGQATPEMSVQVRDLIQTGTFEDLFKTIESEKTGCLCLEQSQAICFVNTHYRWVKKDGYGTFFFFCVSGKIFSARLGWRGNRYGIYLEPLTYDYKWSHEHGLRIVIPQW